LKTLSEKFWSRYFRAYDILNECSAYKVLMACFVEKAAIPKNGLVLDAGCGSGNLSILLKNNDFRVVGIDFNEYAINIAKHKNSDIEYKIHDLRETLPFKNESFECIVSNNVIYALDYDSRERLINELYKVLKPQGICIISSIREGWNPYRILFEEIKNRKREKGYFKTILDAIKWFKPLLVVLWSNQIVLKNKTKEFDLFVREGEVADLMFKSGFIDIKEGTVYSNQAIMTIGKK